MLPLRGGNRVGYLPLLLWLALPVGEFELADVAGKVRSSAEWRERPVLVLAFLGTECPVARQYAGRLSELAERFAPRSVTVLGIFANPGDSAAAIGRMVHDLHLAYPLLIRIKRSWTVWP